MSAGDKKKSGEPEVALPSFEELCLRTSLYRSVSRPKDFSEWANYLHGLKLKAFQFDAYCVQCQKASTFRTPEASTMPLNPQQSTLPSDFSRTMFCARQPAHQYIFHFRVRDDLQKVGQSPSIEDIIGADLSRFRSVLGNQEFRELKTATGLFSHGIGIGSFVYLRRIFERLIYRYRDEQVAEGKAFPDFDKKRMDEKIGALSSVLPPALVKNKSIYSILSNGIHELSEEQCRTYFPAVRAAIIQILEQDLEAKQRKAAEAQLEKEIAKIANAINDPDTA